MFRVGRVRGSFKGVDGWQGSGKGGIRVRVPRGWGSGKVGKGMRER